MLPRVVSALGDLARPAAHYGLVAAILLALALGRDATTLTVLVGGLGAIYSAKAAENFGVAKATGSKP